MKRISLILLIQIYGFMLLAGNGGIKGNIKDAETKESLAGVNIIIQGTSIGAATNTEGYFEINNLKPGEYNLVISYISYKTVVLEKVKVSSGQVIQINELLQTDVVVLNTTNFTVTKLSHSEVALLSVLKESDNVVSGVSAQSIGKTMDRDAADVMKRVPGVTVINGRFIMVRGLSERYNSVWLNGAATPSSEADVKAFSFDVVPGSLIDNLVIYKTASFELPSDFAGGSIQINTKNVPENNGIQFTYGSSYRNGTSFRDFYKTKGGRFDWLGIDDGTRALPDSFPDSRDFIKLLGSSDKEDKNTVTRFGQSMNKNWTIYPVIALPDQRFSITLSKRFNVRKTTIGNITSLNYSNTFTHFNIHRADYQDYDTVKDLSVLYYDFNDHLYTNNVKVGILHNWSLAWGSGNVINFRNLFNQIGINRTLMREGYEYYGGNNIMANEMKFLSRTTYSGQLSGEHKLRNNLTNMDWTLGYAYANRLEPDIKRLSFNKVEEDPTDPRYGQYAMQVFFSASPEKVGRLYSELFEHIAVTSFNLNQKIPVNNNVSIEMMTGFYFEKKYREFNIRNIGYKISNIFRFDQELPFMSMEQLFQNSNINDSTGISLDEKTNASDSYTAGNDLYAAYLGTKIPLFDNKLIIKMGGRFEKDRQKLSSFQSDNPSIPVEVVLDTFTIYPSLNVSYHFNRQNLLRFAYGITVNRPEFREIAPYLYYDFEQKAAIRGNPALKNSYISNFDLRYEIYPSPKENIIFGVFYKDFHDPIEIQYYMSGTGVEYSFVNAQRAQSLGIELDIRKSFESFYKKQGLLYYLRDFSWVFNGSLIKSNVYYDKESIMQNRPMQGQSPFVVNTGIYYQNDTIGLGINVLYNIIGKRIILIGDPYTLSPDVYELPRHAMDVIISKNIGRFLQVKFGIQDLFNQQVIYKQAISFYKNNGDSGEENHIAERDEIRLSYFPGRYYTLSFHFSF